MEFKPARTLAMLDPQKSGGSQCVEAFASYLLVRLADIRCGLPVETTGKIATRRQT
jgi:hypothetical protein